MRPYIIVTVAVAVAVLCVILAVLLFSQKLLSSKTCEHFSATISPFKETNISRKDHATLLSIMKRLDIALKDNNLEYFVIAGSLMGAMRYKNRMPWDDDIDIGIMKELRGKLESLPLEKYGLGIRKVFFGYKVYDLENTRKVMLENTFPFVDIFTFTFMNGKYVYETEKTRKMWSDKLSPEQLYPLATCNYSDMNLPCPAKSIEFLDSVYSGWNTTAYINGSHTGKILLRKYRMPINETTTREVLDYLSELEGK